VDEQASQQLSALARVSDLLEEAAIEYWLFANLRTKTRAGSRSAARS